MNMKNFKISKLTKKQKLLFFTAFSILSVIFLYWQNNSIVVTDFTHVSDKISEDTNGYRMVCLSDLHTKTFANDNASLLEIVKAEYPNVIFLTGDYIDCEQYSASIELAKKLVDIAPVYYVTGNHEYWIDYSAYMAFEDEMKNAGIIIVNHAVEKISDDFYIIGLDDMELNNSINSIDTICSENNVPEDAFKVLLAHEPQYIDGYAKANVDIVFSGHAHGGQFRIPFTDISAIAPDQGLFPKYTSGKHILENTSMYISRGLGNSVIPFRIFNRPEIVSVQLESSLSSKQ